MLRQAELPASKGVAPSEAARLALVCLGTIEGLS